jgi:hypothetical protein
MSESVIVKTAFTKKQLSDAGMALVLILLIIGFFSTNMVFYKVAIPALILNMIVPSVFYPFAVIWYSLSNILGFFVSKIVLSVVFFLIVFPVGLIQKITGKDHLNMKGFKKGTTSVMHNRNYQYKPLDLEKPF